MRNILLLCLVLLGGKSSLQGQEKNSYVTCSLGGQLGNQLFEIASALVTSWEHDAIPVFPDLKTTQEYNIPLNYRKIFFRLNTECPKDINWNKFTLQGFCQNSDVYFQPIHYQPNLHITGWNWQTAYFDRYRSQLIEIFAPSIEEENEINIPFVTEKSA